MTRMAVAPIYFSPNPDPANPAQVASAAYVDKAHTYFVFANASARATFMASNPQFEVVGNLAHYTDFPNIPLYRCFGASNWRIDPGTVPIFTDTTQRDTYWTSPPDGAMCVTADTNTVWKCKTGTWSNADTTGGGGGGGGIAAVNTGNWQATWPWATKVDGSVNPTGANPGPQLVVTRVTLPQAIQAVYIATNTTSSASVRPVVYADTNNAPGALVAQGALTSLTPFDVSISISAPAATCWIGLWSQNASMPTLFVARGINPLFTGFGSANPQGAIYSADPINAWGVASQASVPGTFPTGSMIPAFAPVMFYKAA